MTNIASSLKSDPHVAIQLLIKVASGMPRMQALNEGGELPARARITRCGPEG